MLLREVRFFMLLCLLAENVESVGNSEFLETERDEDLNCQVAILKRRLQHRELSQDIENRASICVLLRFHKLRIEDDQRLFVLHKAAFIGQSDLGPLSDTPLLRDNLFHPVLPHSCQRLLAKVALIQQDFVNICKRVRLDVHLKLLKSALYRR